MLVFKLFAKGLKILQNQKQKVDEEKAVSKKVSLSHEYSLAIYL